MKFCSLMLLILTFSLSFRAYSGTQLPAFAGETGVTYEVRINKKEDLSKELKSGTLFRLWEMYVCRADTKTKPGSCTHQYPLALLARDTSEIAKSMCKEALGDSFDGEATGYLNTQNLGYYKTGLVYTRVRGKMGLFYLENGFTATSIYAVDCKTK